MLRSDTQCASGVFRMLGTRAMLRSVRTRGECRRPPHSCLEVEICDFKTPNASAVSTKQCRLPTKLAASLRMQPIKRQALSEAFRIRLKNLGDAQTLLLQPFYP